VHVLCIMSDEDVLLAPPSDEERPGDYADEVFVWPLRAMLVVVKAAVAFVAPALLTWRDASALGL